jgi:hypothetical protein
MLHGVSELKPEKRRPLWRMRNRIIKMDLKRIGYEDVEWILQAEGRI